MATAGATDCEADGTDADLSGTLVWVGFVVAIFGQLVLCTGLVLLKRAAVVEAELPFYRRGLFWTGVGLQLANSIPIDAIVYDLTPLSLVAPVASVRRRREGQSVWAVLWRA